MPLNIWSVAKDVSIKHLLLLLREDFPAIPQHILDHHETDVKAVRLGNPDDPGHSIYIYTYGQGPDRYGVHLEYNNTGETETKDTVEVFDNLSYKSLVELLRMQFNSP